MRSTLTALIIAALLPGMLRAQPPAADPKVPAEKAESRDVAVPPVIFVPYRNLKSVLDKGGGAVFLPYLDFERLWDRQGASSVDPARAPQTVVLTEATYKGQVEQDVVKIAATLKIRSLGPGWAELPVQFGDAAIGKIDSAGDKILLEGTGNGTYVLLVPAAGEHTVEIELVTRVRTSPDGRSMELDCPPAGITTFDFTIPLADQTVEITPQRVVQPAAPVADPDEGEKVTHITASLGATRKIAARWHPKVSVAPAMELLAGVQNTLDVRMGDGLIHTHAALTWQVLRGQLDQVRVAVPKEHRVLDVTATGLKAWKVAEEGDQQLLTIDLLSGTARTVTVDIQTERPLPDEPFDAGGMDDDGVAHGIHALGAVRESGTLIVSQSPDLSVSVEQQTGLVRLEAAEVPEPLRRPESLFYKFYSPRFRLQLAARPVEPRLLVDHRTQLVFDDDEIRLTATLQYTVERAGVFELRFNLPEGLKVDRVDCEQMQEFQAPANTNLLVVALRERTRGSIGVTVAGHLAFDPANRDSLRLPLLEPLAVTRETGTVLVFTPPALDIVTDEKTLQAAQPFRPIPGSFKPVPDARFAAAWTFTRRPVEIAITTERKPTRLSGSVGTTIEVKQGLVEVVTQLNYNVLYAGLDTFRFAVPEAYAATVQIESADPGRVPIRQMSKGEPEDGWVTWTVVVQREVAGNVPLRIKYDLKTEEQSGAASFAVAPLRVLSSPARNAAGTPVELSGLQGEVTVQKDRALAISATAKDFEEIDVRELSLLRQSGYLAYRYFKQPEKLSEPFRLDLVATKNEVQEVVETVISRSTVEIQINDEATVSYRCRYLMKTSERQRLRIDLPDSARPLDTLVAGKSVDLEKNSAAAAEPTSPDKKWQSFFVNVARTTPSDESFLLSLVFQVTYPPKPLAEWGGRLSLLLPRIGGPASQTQATVAMQQLQVSVWVPEEYALVGTPRHFTPETHIYIRPISGPVTDAGHRPDEWHDQPGGLVAFPTAGRLYRYSNLGGVELVNLVYWNMPVFTWVISGALLLIGLVLVGTSWQNRLTILLLGGFLLTLYALKDAHEAIYIAAAARFGFVAVLVVWFVRAIAQRSETAAAPPAEQFADELPEPLADDSPGDDSAGSVLMPKPEDETTAFPGGAPGAGDEPQNPSGS